MNTGNLLILHCLVPLRENLEQSIPEIYANVEALPEGRIDDLMELYEGCTGKSEWEAELSPATLELERDLNDLEQIDGYSSTEQVEEHREMSQTLDDEVMGAKHRWLKNELRQAVPILEPLISGEYPIEDGQTLFIEAPGAMFGVMTSIDMADEEGHIGHAAAILRVLDQSHVLRVDLAATVVTRAIEAIPESRMGYLAERSVASFQEDMEDKHELLYWRARQGQSLEDMIAEAT